MTIKGAVALALLTACSSSPPLFCDEIIPYSVLVFATDSITGAHAVAGSSLILRDGAFVDSVVGVDGDDSMFAGRGRAGTYTVTVRNPAYSVWSRDDVKIEPETCGVRAATFHVKLQPPGGENVAKRARAGSPLSKFY